MQRDLENTPKRNMDTYKKIVEQINAQMRENGHSFKRTPVECRSRVKRLKTHYFKTKEVNKKSGSRRTSFPYYERMDRLLGRRPIVEPVAQYDSMDCAGDRSDRRLDVESVDGSEVDFTGCSFHLKYPPFFFSKNIEYSRSVTHFLHRHCLYRIINVRLNGYKR